MPRMPLAIIALLTACVWLAGCATSKPASYGSRHTHRTQLSPQDAAACFARNAEEHSGALIAEVRAERDWAQAIVNVRNGVFYASAEYRRSATGATGAITLNVRTSGRRDDLFLALVEGC